MEKKIRIEIIVPENAGNDTNDLVYVAREIFHEAFKGCKEYVDSNVVVWDNNKYVRKDLNDLSFTETGLLVDFNANNVNKADVADRLANAVFGLMDCPEYTGMLVKDKKKSNRKRLKKLIIPTIASSAVILTAIKLIMRNNKAK
jgi:hypothetical protein